MKLIRQWILWPLLAAGLAAAAFLPALQGEFLNWDDHALYVENPYYTGVSSGHWKWMCTTFRYGHWQPLTWLSCALDYKLWGLNPFGWHLTNLLIHAVNAVLVYWLCLAFLKWNTGTRFVASDPEGCDGAQPSKLCIPAVLAALFWAVHPLRVEAVAWLATRGYLLCTTFCLLTVLFYLKSGGTRPPGAFEHARRSRSTFYLAALLCFALVTFTKGIGMMLPLVLLLLDWVPLRRMISFRTAIRCAVEKIPFFALSLVTGVTAFLAKRADGGMAPVEIYGPVQRIGQAIYGVWFYLFKTVSPQNLSPLYEKHPELWQVLAALLLATAAGIFLFLFRRKALPIIGTFCAFLLLIFPMLGITQSGVQLFADRFTYLAAVPFSVLLAGVLETIKNLRRTVHIAFGGLALIFSLQAGTYAFLWNNELCLWRHAVIEDDASIIGQNGLGQALLDQGLYEEALIHFQRASELGESLVVLHNTALAFAKLHRYSEALEKWERAFRLSSSVDEKCKMILARGVVYEQMGDLIRAEQEYNDLVESAGVNLNFFADALQARAVLKIRTGRIQSALPDLQKILILPVSSEQKTKVEEVLVELKKIPEAGASGIF